MENNSFLLDSNALLRYLLKDNLEQFEIVHDLIEDNQCIILKNILQEVIYILEGPVYRIQRKDIRNAIIATFDSIDYEDFDVVNTALNIYIEKPKLDFPDCLLASYKTIYNANIFTFDKKFSKKISAINSLHNIV